MKKIQKNYYKTGDTCPQCHNGKLHDTGEKSHGDRIISCVKCGWEVRENT